MKMDVLVEDDVPELVVVRGVKDHDQSSDFDLTRRRDSSPTRVPMTIVTGVSPLRLAV